MQAVRGSHVFPDNRYTAFHEMRTCTSQDGLQEKINRPISGTQDSTRRQLPTRAGRRSYTLPAQHKISQRNPPTKAMRLNMQPLRLSFAFRMNGNPWRETRVDSG